jgi:hypothetical protein
MFYPVTTPDELAEVAEKLRKNVSSSLFPQWDMSRSALVVA